MDTRLVDGSKQVGVETGRTDMSKKVMVYSAT